LSEAITWWALLQLLGLIALPACVALFGRLPDRGYNFSKVVGLLVLSYVSWIGGSAHLIPSRQATLIAILLVMAALSLLVASRRRSELRELVTTRWPYLLVSEALFTGAFVAALLVRTDVVDVLPGERPTDMAILNAVIRTDYFPPQDPWLSGNDMNYYYFGHFLVGSLAELSAVPARLAFNLGLAAVYALSASAAFGVVFNLVAGRARVAVATGVALLGPLLLLLVSNVVGLFEMMAIHGVGDSGLYDTLDVAGLDGARDSTTWYPTEWVWPNRSISYIDGTVTQQFPFAKFILGELHSENLPIPLVLLLMGSALLIWRSPYERPRLSVESAGLYLLPALALGALAVAQIWYVPALLLLLAGAFGARRYLDDGRLSMALAGQTLAFAAVLTGLAVLLFAPFYAADFGAFNGFVLADEAGVTQPHHFAYMWLPLGWLALSMTIVALQGVRPTLGWTVASALLPLAVVGLWLVAALLDRGAGGLADAVADRAENGNWFTVAALAAALGVTTLAFLGRLARREDGDRDLTLAVGVSAVALALLLGVQFFWVDDNATPGFNTLIKANFLAWFLLSVSAAYALYALLRGVRWHTLEDRIEHVGLAAVGVALLIVGLIYPVTSTLYLTNLFGEPPHLDLLASLEKNHPLEYEAIMWLGENVDGTPVVLEAAGQVSYTDYGQVSAYTGLPTVLGWPPHEFHWRGSWDPQRGRYDTILRIYQTGDPAEAAELMRRFDVQYVYAGRLERLYEDANLEKFAEFMDVVFQNEGVTIYRLPDDGPAAVASP
jgi:YYY domain-containing protein